MAKSDKTTEGAKTPKTAPKSTNATRPTKAAPKKPKGDSGAPSRASGARTVEAIIRSRGGFDPGFILRIWLEGMGDARAYVYVDPDGSEAWRTSELWEEHRPGDDPTKPTWDVLIKRVGRKEVPAGDPAQELGRYPTGTSFDKRADAFFKMAEYLAGPGGGWYKLRREVVWQAPNK